MQFQRQSGDVHPATGPVIHWIAVRDTTPIDDDQATFCNRDVLYIKVTVTEHLSIQQTILGREGGLLDPRRQNRRLEQSIPTKA